MIYSLCSLSRWLESSERVWDVKSELLRGHAISVHHFDDDFFNFVQIYKVLDKNQPLTHVHLLLFQFPHALSDKEAAVPVRETGTANEEWVFSFCVFSFLPLIDERWREISRRTPHYVSPIEEPGTAIDKLHRERWRLSPVIRATGFALFRVAFHEVTLSVSQTLCSLQTARDYTKKREPFLVMPSQVQRGVYLARIGSEAKYALSRHERPIIPEAVDDIVLKNEKSVVSLCLNTSK